jgi:aminoglycoside 3-N-acetyltransferase
MDLVETPAGEAGRVRSGSGRTGRRRIVFADGLADGLGGLGLGAGDCVLVHGSLSAFGYLVGGAQTLYLGLRSLLGVGGTVVAPSFTPQLCHPSAWREPSLAAYAERALDSVPAFDPWLTPASPAMGVLPELVRALPGSRRSSHPHASFVAEGRRAAQITARHRLGYRLSDTSPLGALWDLDASILMLGTGWKSCTALHLAEYAAPYPGRRVGLWPVPQTGPARDPRPTGWLYVPELLCWDGDFELLGAAYERSGEPLSAVSIGDARCLLVPCDRWFASPLDGLWSTVTCAAPRRGPAGRRSGSTPGRCRLRTSPGRLRLNRRPDPCQNRRQTVRLNRRQIPLPP